MLARFVLGRLAGLVPVLFVLSVVTFTVMHLIPGDPIEIMFGGQVDAATIDATRARLGLNQPLLAQYMVWVQHLAEGNLGRSFQSRQPVGQIIRQRLPVTLELTGLAVLLVVCITLPLGVLTAVHRDTWVDGVASTVALLGITTPAFFLGILLIQLFSLQLHWLPPLGFVPLREDPLGNLRVMLMPTVTVAAGLAAVMFRMVRGSLLHVLTQPYVVVARAKGLRERRVIYHHALRNALIPVVTILGLQIGALFGGTVLTETVFGLPGVGRLLVDSIFAREFTIVQAIVLLFALVRVGTSFVVDVLYAVLDPRISFG
jgi:peptide/nickel transport system permease protein